jgi:SAM-dependent methyltransferase
MTLNTITPTTNQALLEIPRCDLCGSVAAEPYLTTRDHLYGTEGEWQLVRCDTCGLIYLIPRPTPAHIGAYYPDLDYHAFVPTRGLKARVIDWLHEREVRGLLHDLPRGARILEIGCGTGEMLLKLRVHGSNVMGIEPNAAAAQVAREQHGLDVRTDILDTVMLDPASFDLILMRYALEHVHSPLGTLKQIAALLKPAGRTVVWIPNLASWDARLFGSYWRGLDAPRHLYLFTPTTIQRLLAEAGLRLSAITYSGVPNDWAGSAEAWLRKRNPAFAKIFGMKNPLMLLAWLPFSLIAALVGQAGRMQVTARK